MWRDRHGPQGPPRVSARGNGYGLKTTVGQVPVTHFRVGSLLGMRSSFHQYPQGGYGDSHRRRWAGGRLNPEAFLLSPLRFPEQHLISFLCEGRDHFHSDRKSHSDLRVPHFLWHCLVYSCPPRLEVALLLHPQGPALSVAA